ncbi:MAG: AAA family ATPase [Treponema sp.]|uniref:AAA family ATPase n=1 Tax=Treponema sp. TaxID=166 RepID=UPI001B6603B3|nr:AAA family ATPase [Treponema sp.]MBP5402507.1 AAA family ATPase [Treponema sp.]MBR5933127.1 AAA family ATPase [Treponema sp.]
MYSEYENMPSDSITAKSLDECRAILFEKFGNSYQITDIKTELKSSFLGFFPKEYVKVKYIIRGKNPSYQDSVNTFEKNKDELLKTLNPSVNTTKQIAALDKKLDQLSSLLENKFDDIKTNSEQLHKNIIRISEMLEENEFTKEYIKDICDRLRSEFSLEELEDFDKVEKQVVDWIGESILIAKKKAHAQPHVIVVVGPTGVGKTTTIAKIAAQQIIVANREGLERPEIRLISADVTRVAAEEQLRHFGDALKVQVDKAEKAEDIKFIYRDCKDTANLIMIDTSGYSPNDSESIGRLKKHLSVDGLRPDVYLAVTASTKAKDLRNIIQNYEPFGFSSVIVTKCDETSQYGNIISVLSEKHKSISYITYGQAAAKDISRADVVGFLIRLSGFKIDRTHIDDKFGE